MVTKTNLAASSTNHGLCTQVTTPPSLPDQEPWDTRINKESVSIILIMKYHYSDLNVLSNADLSKAYAPITHSPCFSFFLIKTNWL